MKNSPSSSSYTSKDLRKLLRVLEKKLEAPMLNGGFDTLFLKVESIESAINKLNLAVFDPEKGLFVKVQTEKIVTDHDVNDLNGKVSKIEDQIKSYKKFTLGIVASVATTILGIVAKFAWDFISNHLTYH